MLKICGICGIVISLGLVGINKSLVLKSRIELLEDYYRMIMALKSQINYFKEPLPEIFKRMPKNNNSKGFSFINNLGIQLTLKQWQNEDLWHKMIDSEYRNCSLTIEDKKIMAYLGGFLGQTNYENQIQHFKYLEDRLKQQIENAKYEYHNKSPMYNKLGFFIGTIIGIIFI